MMAESLNTEFLGFQSPPPPVLFVSDPSMGETEEEKTSYHFSECKSLEVSSLLVVGVMYILQKKKKNLRVGVGLF